MDEIDEIKRVKEDIKKKENIKNLTISDLCNIRNYCIEGRNNKEEYIEQSSYDFFSKINERRLFEIEFEIKYRLNDIFNDVVPGSRM